MSRVIELAVDCRDADAVRPFWREALGYHEVEVHGTPELHDPEGRGPAVWFQPVPEPKVAKNRLHLDVWLPKAEEPALRARLLELGGTVRNEAASFVVLQDPEGNELCLCWGDGSGVPGT